MDILRITASLPVQVAPGRYRAWVERVWGEGRTPTAARETAIRNACLLILLLSRPTPEEAR